MLRQHTWEHAFCLRHVLHTENDSIKKAAAKKLAEMLEAVDFDKLNLSYAFVAECACIALM